MEAKIITKIALATFLMSAIQVQICLVEFLIQTSEIAFEPIWTWMNSNDRATVTEMANAAWCRISLEWIVTNGRLKPKDVRKIVSKPGEVSLEEEIRRALTPIQLDKKFSENVMYIKEKIDVF